VPAQQCPATWTISTASGTYWLVSWGLRIAQALLSDRLALVLIAGCILGLACLGVMVCKIRSLQCEDINGNEEGRQATTRKLPPQRTPRPGSLDSRPEPGPESCDIHISQAGCEDDVTAGEISSNLRRRGEGAATAGGRAGGTQHRDSGGAGVETAAARASRRV